jgi:hypothetical protein
MNEKAKITLSVKELELVCNTDWILTKHAIIQEVFLLFGELSAFMQAIIAKEKEQLPVEVIRSQPKISKGENYENLPYVMLDYPRCFQKENTIAIRTFFWWGNFFSVNLQLSGAYKEQLVPVIQNNFSMLQQNDYWICVSDNPWEHHFEADNYQPIIKITKEEFSSILSREPFVKIAKKIPLTQWEQAPALMEQPFTELLLLLKN